MALLEGLSRLPEHATPDPPAAQPTPGSEDLKDREARRLTAEVNKLLYRNQLLQWHVIELQEALAQEAQRYADLVRSDEGSRDQEAKVRKADPNAVRDRFDERSRTDDLLKSVQGAQADGRLRMCESYRGEVVHVHGDRVVVAYDVDGNVAEQTYERSQFLEGRLPEVDTELVVYVMVAEVEPRAGETASVEEERRDDVPSGRREPLAGPTIF